MKRSREKPIPLETQLGMLAMQFRHTWDATVRANVATEYAKVVKRLLKRGKWKVIPLFEDMLPDKYMPKEFYDYWDIPCPHGRNGSVPEPE